MFNNTAIEFMRIVYVTEKFINHCFWTGKLWWKTGEVGDTVSVAAGEEGGVVAGETVCRLTDNIGSECEAAGRVEGKVVDYGWLEKDAKEDCCSFHCRSYNHVHNILSFFDGWANFLFTASETKRYY